MPSARRSVQAALLACLVLAGCLEEPPAPAGDPKEDALVFALRVVETYFTQDVEAFRAMLAPTLYTLEGEGPITPAQVDEWLARERPYPSGRDYSNHTLEEYLATYEPEVLTFDEVRARFPEFNGTQWEGWTPDGDDYVFLGAKVKEGREGFLWDDLLAFGLTRETGEWRFKAFSG